ncbi:MAG: ATP-dependent helicase [Nitrospirota bacterium]
MIAKTTPVTLPWLEAFTVPAEPIPAEPLLVGLNAEQREVAMHGEGPLLVLAVAGSGKTMAMAHRVAYLVSARNIPPAQILCLTFTNKAACEMRERIARVAHRPMQDVTVATFHGFCARLVRSHHDLIPRSDRFRIYDGDDSRRLVKAVAEELDAPGMWESLRADIDRLKHLGIAPGHELAASAASVPPTAYYLALLDEAYRRYERRLERDDAVDFPDLLLKALRLLETYPPVADRVRRRYRHILVDEYQDTCPLQERVLQFLAAPAYNVCAVGDDDQAIYAFRHADAAGILNFEARFPGATVIRMETNYRSSGRIVAVARRIISTNRHRTLKAITTSNATGEPVEVVACRSAEHEAGWIADTIAQLARDGAGFGEIAILGRVASLFRPVEQALADAQIPYSLVDGLAFWERREIKDAMAFLRFIDDPSDAVSFKRIANLPPRGVGKRVMARIDHAIAAHRGKPVMENLLGVDGIPRRLRAFLNMMDALRATSFPVSRMLETVLERVGYEEHVTKTYSDSARRLANLTQLVDIARRFDRDVGGDLGAFLTHVAGNDHEAAGNQTKTVRLMTIHAAKGLEFRIVFVVGLEDGVLPHARDRDNLEEERRLFYVAATRARERLFLSWSAQRVVQGREMSHRLSPFVREILPQRAGAWGGERSDAAADPVVICHQPRLQRQRETVANG